MQCEICGVDTELVTAEIEGSLLNVCRKCASFGKIVERKEKKENLKRVKRYFDKEVLDLIVEDFSERVKNARESLGLKQEEMGDKVGEKESVIHNLERGKIKPSIVLAKKLEKFLNIKLIEEYKDENVKFDFKNTSLTIGDLIKIKKKK